MSERLDRQLVAVMFTDIVGYTALMQADERLGLNKRDKYMRTLERHHDAWAYTDVASVRGVGPSLIGLAAIEAVENRPARTLQIAAAAEDYAQQEGIVNVYSDETPGREFVDQARAALSARDVAHATEAGGRLAIKEALDLARIPQTAAG